MVLKAQCRHYEVWIGKAKADVLFSQKDDKVTDG